MLERREQILLAQLLERAYACLMLNLERVIFLSQKIISLRAELKKLELELQDSVKSKRYSTNPSKYGQTCQEICVNILKAAYPQSVSLSELRKFTEGYAAGTLSSRLSALKQKHKIEHLPNSTYRWIKSNGVHLNNEAKQ